MKLEEAFFDYKPTPFFLTSKLGKNFEIFVNPTKKELSEFGEDGYRFLANVKDKKLYVFSAYILHQFAAEHIFGEIDLYKSPHILAGTMYGKPAKLEDLVPFNPEADEVFDKSFYEKIKEYDWDWIKKYLNIPDLEKQMIIK